MITVPLVLATENSLCSLVTSLEPRLRALLIADLGPNGDPLWSADRLAADVLETLPLNLEQAREWVTDWTARPRHQMRTLRTCKNLIRPMELVVDRLTTGPVRTQIGRWMDLKKRLP